MATYEDSAVLILLSLIMKRYSGKGKRMTTYNDNRNDEPYLELLNKFPLLPHTDIAFSSAIFAKM
jgi:hypothetical protein